MSPPPELSLDVQKYVGTCLISQKPRGKKKHSNVTANGSSKQSDNTSSSKEMQMPTGTMSTPIPICDCCGGYKMSNVSSMNSAWAGMPLISLANHKKSKNRTSKTKDSGGKPLMIGSPPSSSMNSGASLSSVSSSSSSSCDDVEKLPLSRLALHTQGAPLILSGGSHYMRNSNGCNNGHGCGAGGYSAAKAHAERNMLKGGHLIMGPLADQYAAKMSSAHLFVEGTLEDIILAGSCGDSDSKSEARSSSSSTSDCMSVTSEESSGISENSLPRIIKPRKRRKKDRKPLTRSNSSALVTLKPYMPLCYKFPEDINNGFTSREDDDLSVEPLFLRDRDDEEDNLYEDGASNQLDNDDQDPMRQPRNQWLHIPTKYPYPPSRHCTCYYCVSSSPISSTSRPTPFLTPPPSPSPPSSPPAYDDQSGGTCDVSARIVTSPNGNRDLEIKIIPLRSLWEESVSSGGDSMSSLSSPPLSSSSSNSDNAFPGPEKFRFTASHPPQRPWVQLAMPDRRKAACIFTVMCYNVLCDKYATRQMYGYCPNWALNWDYRRKGILDEIRHYSADIISLQEIETEQFYNFFLPELKRDGYDGIFSPKSRAKTMSESERKFVDGCAIFYQTNKFKLIKEHLVEFNQLAMANAEGSDHMLNRVMTKDNIGLAALLETKENAWDNGVPPNSSQVHQPLLVCTAHIHWDPEYCDVKLIQTMMLMHELRTIAEDSIRIFRPGIHKPDCNSIPVILCGDFNSLPESGVIEFLQNGRVCFDHPDFKDLGYKSCLQKLSSLDKPNEFTHSFKMARGYSDDIMPFTNYTFDFKNIIDYIFFSKQHINPLGLLGGLDPEWLREHKVVGCPHPHIPSDHFSLLIECEMFPTNLGPANTNGLVLRR